MLRPYAASANVRKSVKEWHPTAFAPFDRDIQVSVIEKSEVHALVVSCRRTQSGWVRSTGEQLFIDPTHWREWIAE